MKALSALVSALFFCTLAVAQQQNVPSVTMMPIDPVAVAIGKSAPVSLTFRVNNGFHINSNKPNSDLLIPTALKLDVPTELMIAKINYPEGQQAALEFSPDEKMSVYSGDFTITAMVRPALNSSPGTYRVHGGLRFQACNNRQCFPPKTLPVQFDIKIARAARHH
jgi:hypothetical protein